MSEPVKLSRERWEMLLTRAKISSIKAHIDYSSTDERISVFVPTTCRDITFLPAEYVPADDGSHVEYHFRNGSSIAVG